MSALIRLLPLLIGALLAPVAVSQEAGRAAPAAAVSAPQLARYRDLLEQVRQVINSPLSAEQKKLRVSKLLEDYPQLRKLELADDPKLGNTPQQIAASLELMIFEQAALLAPDAESESIVLRRLEDDGQQPSTPPQIAPLGQRRDIIVVNPITAETEDLEPVTVDAQHQSVAQVPESEKSPPVKEKPELEDKVKVEVMAEDEVTEEMHDDNTVLRQVADTDGSQLMSDRWHFWAGGALQYDVHRTEGVLGLQDGGNSEIDSGTRRAEVIVRAGLLRRGEVKLQYDIDGTLWRDLYWRWVFGEKNSVLTVGNQKEPMGMDFLMGNKFDSPMERSAPASAFGSFRGKGIRLNGWKNLEGQHQALTMFGEARESALTGTLGIFTEGLDGSKDTDLALTGRITYGWRRPDETGLHLGISATAREGEFDSISPRPESQNSSRVPLARFDAERQYAIALEGLYVHGPLYAQTEFYVSDFRDGDIDARGWGGYLQGAWMLTGDHRKYRPRWGLLAPVKPRKEHAFEVFARASYTRGDGDDQTWNSLAVLTLGGNWYYRKLRGSLNLLLGDTRRDVQDEGSGTALTARIQYLF
jgi:phosphate-selective porin OprO/OprP